MATHSTQRALQKACASRSETGVAGLSIEARRAMRRIRSIRSTPQSRGFVRRATQLTRRAAIRFWSDAPSAFSWEGPDLDETIARLRAYAQAGADSLYAPGIRTREQIAAVVAGVAPKPLNLLIGSASELTMAQIAALGVRRVSVGGALARTAWGGFMRAARLIAEQGHFDGLANAASGAELDSFFRDDLEKRSAR